jgi:hypothetical protein
MTIDRAVYQLEAWSASVAARALRTYRSRDGSEVCRDPGSLLLSLAFALTAFALLILTIGSLALAALP